MNVLLIFGGNSSENEISKKSALSIVKNIDRDKFNLESVYISKENKWFVYDEKDDIFSDTSFVIEIDNIINYIKKFDIIFPIIHGMYGEDGKLQGFLELFNIPFVGSKTTSSAIGMDKGFSKIIFDHLKIRQTPYIVINYPKYNYFKVIKNLKFPMIVKPSNGGSSIGISKANNHHELIEAIKLASKYDSKIIIEEFIKARELECAVLEDKELVISPVGEIISKNDFYDYEAKYLKESKLIIPANITNKLEKEIKKITEKIFKKLNCKGLARIDFLYDDDNKKLYINEINTLPGFTEISMYPKLLMNNNVTYKDLITKIIKSSI